jgi:hypothetical protein
MPPFFGHTSVMKRCTPLERDVRQCHWPETLIVEIERFSAGTTHFTPFQADRAPCSTIKGAPYLTSGNFEKHAKKVKDLSRIERKYQAMLI